MLDIIAFAISIIIVLSMFAYLRWRNIKNNSLQEKNNRLKSEFVTVVTHKFRTPITRIKWATHMLHDNATFQNKEDLLKEVERAVEQITGIIDLLTDFDSLAAKKEKDYEPVSLRQLITNSIEKHAEMTREKKMTFDIRVNNDVPSLRLDKNKIELVTDILIENALKYTGAGGQIIVGLMRDGKDAILSVTDSGIGMSPEDIELAFQGFWRGAEAKKIDTEGMGLSLRTAKAIVEGQGGQLWAESPGPNLGTSFFVRLEIKGYDFKFK